MYFCGSKAGFWHPVGESDSLISDACMRDSQGDVTHTIAIQSCGLTLVQYPAASLRVERAAGHSPQHSPCLRLNPLLAICSLVVFLRSPDTVNGAGLSHIRTTFSRGSLYDSQYCILPACNCSLPCLHTQAWSRTALPHLTLHHK